jgi:hypothetical protein
MSPVASSAAAALALPPRERWFTGTAVAPRAAAAAVGEWPRATIAPSAQHNEKPSALRFIKIVPVPWRLPACVVNHNEVWRLVIRVDPSASTRIQSQSQEAHGAIYLPAPGVAQARRPRVHAFTVEFAVRKASLVPWGRAAKKTISLICGP